MSIYYFIRDEVTPFSQPKRGGCQQLRHIAFIVKEPKNLYDFTITFRCRARCQGPYRGHTRDRRPFQPGILKARASATWRSSTPIAPTARKSTRDRESITTDFLWTMWNELSTGWTARSTRRYAAERPAGGDANLGPMGNKVDLSARGFLGREEKKLPGVRYVVIQTEAPERAAEFYKSIFELREIGKASDGSLRLSDGDITLELTKKQSIEKPGIQYFGFQVKDWSQAQSRFKEIGLELPEPKRAKLKSASVIPKGICSTCLRKAGSRVATS